MLRNPTTRGSFVSLVESDPGSRTTGPPTPPPISVDQTPSKTTESEKKAEAHLARGIDLLNKNRKAAEAEFLHAAKANPNSAKIWGRLGGFYIDGGRFSRAVDMLRKAISLEPDHVMHRAELAHALLALGRREEAIKEARAAIALGGTADDHMIFEDLGLIPMKR